MTFTDIPSASSMGQAPFLSVLRRIDDGLFDMPGTAFRHTPAEFFYIFRRADEVSVVVREQAVIAVGDNHLMITENHGGKDFIRQFQIFERYMDIRRLALYPCLIQTDAAIGENLPR